jgi:hypothetical protein
MPNPESSFYREMHTTPVESTKLHSDENQSSPFGHDITPMATSSKPSEKTFPVRTMELVGETPGRVITETASRDKVVWGGKYESDIYGARDMKGVRHGNPIIEERDYDRGSFRVAGLWDCIVDDTEYIIKVSDYLRSNGLPTEHPVNIYELKEIALNGKVVSIDEWKKWAIDEYKGKNPNNDTGLANATEYIEKARFFVVERELQTSERLRDIGWCANKEDFETALSSAFKWINVATKAKNNGIIPGTEKPEDFHIENPEDVQRYFSDWIPKQMGTYVGRLSKLGLAAHYLHAQNWSCAGTMYDLDSVTGQVFGEPATESDFNRDLRWTMGSLEELLNPTGGNYITENYPDMLLTAKANFIKSYLDERGSINRPNYKYFMDNSYFDGKNRHDRYIKPDDWVKIVKILGFEIDDADYDAIRDYYSRTIEERFEFLKV